MPLHFRLYLLQWRELDEQTTEGEKKVSDGQHGGGGQQDQVL